MAHLGNKSQFFFTIHFWFYFYQPRSWLVSSSDPKVIVLSLINFPFEIVTSV